MNDASFLVLGFWIGVALQYFMNKLKEKNRRLDARYKEFEEKHRIHLASREELRRKLRDSLPLN